MNKRKKIVELMNTIISSIPKEELRKYDSTDIVDAHINLLIQYCNVLGVDPKELFKHTLETLGDDDSVMINGIKLEWQWSNIIGD